MRDRLALLESIGIGHGGTPRVQSEYKRGCYAAKALHFGVPPANHSFQGGL